MVKTLSMFSGGMTTSVRRELTLPSGSSSGSVNRMDSASLTRCLYVVTALAGRAGPFRNRDAQHEAGPRRFTFLCGRDKANRREQQLLCPVGWLQRVRLRLWFLLRLVVCFLLPRLLTHDA